MAKRLNKKVAIIGSLVLAMLIFAGIIIILKLSRDPQEYLKDAETALALPEPDYKAAEKAYKRAFGYAKKDMDLKIDILFKLSDMFISQNEWTKAAGCWNQVINIDPKNLNARLKLFDYFYQLATSGNWTAWKQVESNASKLIEEQLDATPRMYRIKGQALVELVKRGQMTDKEKSIGDAIENLQKAMQAEPNNVDVYQILADAIVQKEIENENLLRELWQAFVVLLPIRTVGVMGDDRTYENVAALRIVTSMDGMTADWAKIPYTVLEKISTRIVNEVKGINRVVYDITSKPPGTIEWE